VLRETNGLSLEQPNTGQLLVLPSGIALGEKTLIVVFGKK
jgi:hypothetical protein